VLKLLVCDLDGTLLPYGREAVSGECKRLLALAQEHGVQVAISSGRTYGELARFLPEFTSSFYFICCDGAYTLKGERILYTKPLAVGDVDELARRRLPESGLLLHGVRNAYTIGKVPANDATYFSAAPATGVRGIREEIYKVTLYGQSVALPAFSALRVHWEGSDGRCTQMVDRYANKGVALSNLQMRLGISKFETACIGDAENDIPMMRNAKYAVCIGERSRDLRDACNLFYSTAEDAIGALLRD
jgi:HAD superfamily hydrolase (TIGR01484 family)